MIYGMIAVSEEDRRPQEFPAASVALLLKTERSYGSDSAISL